MGETLREGTHLDIESELNLIKETRRELKDNCSSEKAVRRTMKELGLKRSDTNNFVLRMGKNMHVYCFVSLVNNTANLLFLCTNE